MLHVYSCMLYSWNNFLPSQHQVNFLRSTTSFYYPLLKYFLVHYTILSYSLPVLHSLFTHSWLFPLLLPFLFASTSFFAFSIILCTCTMSSSIFRACFPFLSPSNTLLSLSLLSLPPLRCLVCRQWLQKHASELRGVKHYDNHCREIVMCCLFDCLTHLATCYKATSMWPSGL